MKFESKLKIIIVFVYPYRNSSHACWPSQLYLLLHRGILDSIRNLREYVIVTFLFLVSTAASVDSLSAALSLSSFSPKPAHKM